MKKLIASGCSFTKYLWPTWFDFLKNHFDTSINYGKVGAGNQYIARQILNNPIENDTTVVAMWSGFNRFDHVINDEWITKGNVLFEKNEKYLNGLFAKIYNPEHFYKSSIENIYTANSYCNNNGIKIYNFLAFPIKTPDFDRPKYFNLSYHLEDHIKFILPDLWFYSLKNRLKNVKYDKNLDFHPRPSQHYKFYKDIICPEMNLSPIVIDDNILLDMDKKSLEIK
jgi:hypothetical protein